MVSFGKSQNIQGSSNLSKLTQSKHLQKHPKLKKKIYNVGLDALYQVKVGRESLNRAKVSLRDKKFNPNTKGLKTKAKAMKNKAASFAHKKIFPKKLNPHAMKNASKAHGEVARLRIKLGGCETKEFAEAVKSQAKKFEAAGDTESLKNLNKAVVSDLKRNNIHESKTGVTTYITLLGEDPGGHEFKSAFGGDDIKMLDVLDDATIQLKGKEGFIESILFENGQPKADSKELVLKALEQQVPKEQPTTYFRETNATSKLYAAYVRGSLSECMNKTLPQDFFDNIEKLPQPPSESEIQEVILLFYEGINTALENGDVPHEVLDVVKEYSQMTEQKIADAETSGSPIPKAQQKEMRNNAVAQFLLRGPNSAFVKPSNIGRSYSTDDRPRAALQASVIVQLAANRPDDDVPTKGYGTDKKALMSAENYAPIKEAHAKMTSLILGTS